MRRLTEALALVEQGLWNEAAECLADIVIALPRPDWDVCEAQEILEHARMAASGDLASQHALQQKLENWVRTGATEPVDEE